MVFEPGKDYLADGDLATSFQGIGWIRLGMDSLPVTAEMAVLFGMAFGQTPQYWINLQATYDLKIAEKAVSRRVAGIRQLTHA